MNINVFSNLMRLVRKNGFYLIMIILSIILFSKFEEVLGNPIPVDTNWEASPIPGNYNSSVFLKQEFLNVTFDSSKLQVEAIYIFKNNNETELNLTILLPFSNFECKSPRPEILNIKLDGKEIDYLWSNSSYYLKEDFDTCGYHFIKYNITFSAFEERIIEIHYLRDYMRYDSCDKTYYGYIYIVGSAREWNHSIELARFELWIPKSICDGIEWAPYIIRLGNGNNISSITSQQDYYVASLQYNNWILPPDGDFIRLDWSKTKPWHVSLMNYLSFCDPAIGMIVVILIFCSLLLMVIIIAISFKYRRKRDSYT